MDQQLTIRPLVFALLGETGRIARTGCRREGGEGAQRVVDFSRIRLDRMVVDGVVGGAVGYRSLVSGSCSTEHGSRGSTEGGADQ